jgi:hypothetical protein
MSHRNIPQPAISSIVKISHNFKFYFQSRDRSKWVNGRPVLMNGDVWCPMCETWHVNNSLCQQSN